MVAPVGNHGGPCPYAGNVERFAGIDANHAVVGCRLRQAAKRNVFAAGKNNIRMNFIRYDKHIMLQTEFGHAGQFFPGKTFADRIVRIAQQEHRGALFAEQFFQIGKVDFIAAVCLVNQIVAQDMPAVVGDDFMKRVIRRHLDDDIVARFGKGPHGVNDRRNDRRRVFDPVLVDIPAKAFFLPVGDGMFKGFHIYRIAENAVLRPPDHGLDNRLRAFEVRVGDPHRDYVLGVGVPFLTIGSSAVNQFVKIVFHHQSTILIYLPVVCSPSPPALSRRAQTIPRANGPRSSSA